ncbi:GNAT family protein [Jeotgalibacillus sp. ET6]|uniref:GNAT family N-acetyltransferase n=1 Tax=Jeotgalibacillus sp. ET6 TaxID=3037260 RepID=UPI00241823CF|nr:GNAT family protein [Jeotgalibacillus sp. ET6]MDG5472079.1 GNAT family protein [Jeotgalibacillus sp. ET6]
MNPILLEVPERIETERLVLRMPRPGDGEVVNEAIRHSIHELRPWLGFAQSLPTVEETEINTREAHIKFLSREALRYLIFVKETGEFVGSSGFHNIRWEMPKVELGYWMDTRMSGKGLMTEAVGALKQFALSELGCKRVEIQCEKENLKSRNLAERLGFDLEGILRNEDLSVDGKRLTDTYIYAKVQD